MNEKHTQTHTQKTATDRCYVKVKPAYICAATFHLFCINNDTETIKECSITCSVASTNYQLSLEFVVILINNKAEGKSE